MEAEIKGRLQASVRVEGRGGLSSMVGQGQASVVGGRVSKLPAQELIASLLQAPSLREIEFEECVVEFTLAGNILETPVIRFLSPLVQVTGKGSVSLEQNTLDHDMMLALSQEVLSQLPAPLLRVFKLRASGVISTGALTLLTHNEPPKFTVSTLKLPTALSLFSSKLTELTRSRSCTSAITSPSLLSIKISAAPMEK